MATIRDDLLNHGIAAQAKIERHLDHVRPGTMPFVLQETA